MEIIGEVGDGSMALSNAQSLAPDVLVMDPSLTRKRLAGYVGGLPSSALPWWGKVAREKNEPSITSTVIELAC